MITTTFRVLNRPMTEAEGLICRLDINQETIIETGMISQPTDIDNKQRKYN